MTALSPYPKLPCPFPLRPGTDDEVVWHCVVEANEYRLPERFRPDDIVLDLGAHIGVFSHLALERGSRRVEAYEAEPGNAARARANLAPWGDAVAVHQSAVWRSDRGPETLHFTASNDPGSSGGGNVFFLDHGAPVSAVPFDSVVRDLTARHGRSIRFLKIDVEAAEFPILLTSSTLRLVDEIAGEFHEAGGERDPHVIPAWSRVDGYPRFTIEVLAQRLRRRGFEVWWVRFDGTNQGLFFATRVSWPRWFAGRLRALVRRIFQR